MHMAPPPGPLAVKKINSTSLHCYSFNGQTGYSSASRGENVQEDKFKSFTHSDSLYIRYHLLCDFLQAAPQLSHLSTERGHTTQNLVQLVPELQLLVRGKTLQDGLYCCKSLTLGLQNLKETEVIRDNKGALIHTLQFYR